MDGENRRNEIIQILKESASPISGTSLAKALHVSRQIIVQDIALLRAINRNILSTNKGYLLQSENRQPDGVCRIIKVKHKDSEIQDELYTIVDLGGYVLDVTVEHAIYGQISVDLIINNRLDVDNFVKQVKMNQTRPLNDLTKGVHYHTIVAKSDKMLDYIEQELLRKGYLIS